MQYATVSERNVGDFRYLARVLLSKLHLAFLFILTRVDALSRCLAWHKPKIQNNIRGIESNKSKKLCVFSHFDRGGMVDDYVFYYLSTLNRLGLDIVFVSTAVGLDDASVEKLSNICQIVLVRNNIGYDFGSWKIGLEQVAYFEEIETLVLANDSVYGPVHDLEPVFAKMRERNLDVWGITDSWQLSYHLQSYFLVFGKAALESPVFWRFWKQLPFYYFKRALIWNCEVGLSRQLMHAGLSIGALCEYARMREDHTVSVLEAESRRFSAGARNSTHSLWKLLMEQYACPFIKVGLLRDNPENLNDLHKWVEVLRKNSSYDVALIQRHLARMSVGANSKQISKASPST